MVPAYSMVNGGDILGEEHQIVRLVYEAKKSPEAADSLDWPVYEFHTGREQSALPREFHARSGRTSLVWPCLLFMRRSRV